MEVVAELETIKWLLVAMLVGIVLVTLSAVAIAITIWLGFRLVQEQNSGQVFRLMAEDYLSQNENDELEKYAKERLRSHPQDIWAHWYLGQATFHVGNFPVSKRCFERVIELDPAWYGSVEAWLERVNEKLKKGPHLVD
jgi:cytochrome c-type biogenesis protein CcmH/NrfG